MGSVRWATSLHQDITTRKCYWYTYKHIMCSLLSSIHENNCFLFFKRYHMNIYPSATQKLPPTLWTISRASIARSMSKSPRRGHIACEFWKIEDVAFIFSVYFMALWTFAYDHGYRNCDRAGSASTRWVGAVVQGLGIPVGTATHYPNECNCLAISHRGKWMNFSKFHYFVGKMIAIKKRKQWIIMTSWFF